MKLFISFGALVSALLGYDLGVLSAAIPHLRAYFDLHPAEIEIMVGIFSVVQAFGTPIAGYFADVVGRKPMLAGSCVIATIGTLLMTCAESYTMLLTGRMVTGVGVGAGLAIAPTYLAELSSQKSRGNVVACMEVYINVGILLGFVSGAVFSYFDEPLAFRLMFAVGLLPCICVLLALKTMPESPRWLAMQGRQGEAHHTLVEVLEDETEVAFTYGKMLEELNQDQEDLFTRRNILPLRTCIGLACIFAFSGVDCVVYYTSPIFEAAGETDQNRADVYAVAMAVAKTATVVFAVLFFDSTGRKPLITASFAGMFLSMLATAFLGIQMQSSELVFVCLTLYMCSFSLGVGPGFYLLSTEVWPLQSRAAGTAFAATIRSAACAILNISFLTLVNMFGYVNILAIFAALSCLGSFFYMVLRPRDEGNGTGGDY